VAQYRPDLLRKLILAEPGGELDATLDPAYKPGPSPLAARIAASAEVIAKGDIDGGLQIFMDALEGPGAWKRLPATPKQLLRDNATTLIGQMRDQRPPFSRKDAEAIKTPTLFIGGAAEILRDRAGISCGLKRDEIWMNRHRALGLCLSMIFRENRCTLFRIMLWTRSRPVTSGRAAMSHPNRRLAG
jgi:pimeloyl-ACP methyl ester carboxylesterase